MSAAIKSLPEMTVGTTPVQAGIPGQNWHKWGSVRVQADPGNSGKVYVGNNNVSTTNYTAVLVAGDYYSIVGSAVDPNKVWLLGTAAGQVVAVSGT